jgi:hypothetical protein
VEFTVSLVALPCLYSLQLMLMELKGLTEVINVLTCIREAPKWNLRPIIGYADRRIPFTPAFPSNYIFVISHGILLSCSAEVAIRHCAFK